MYSISANKKNRFVAPCILNHTVTACISTLVDTGAFRTCYHASYLVVPPAEETMLNSPSIRLDGFVAGASLKFYQYTVRQFTLGSIDLGTQNIWITFDKRIAENVVGMDILQQVYFMHLADKQQLCLFKTQDELNAYFYHPIQRKCYKQPDGLYYIFFANAKCLFKPNNVKRDAYGCYIMLQKQKCYLDFVDSKQ